MESDEDLFCSNEGSEDEENWNSNFCDYDSHTHVMSNDTDIQKDDLNNEEKTSEKEEKKPEDVEKKNDSLMTRMELNDHKAGMEGLDKQKINNIIYEISKGSRFFINEKKKEEQVKQRIDEQRKRMMNVTPEQLKHGLKEADVLLKSLESSRDLSRTIVHVDMDAFYAAVEMRDDPSLKHKPMAVGGMGMLSTSNYAARKYGVRAGMPGFIGLKLCPQLIMVSSNFDKYRAVSKDIRAVMADYDPNYCPMSLDEAYLDFTDHLLKRQLSSDKDRTFLVKDCSSDDKTLCMCDLNLHLRDTVLSEKNRSQATSSKNIEGIAELSQEDGSTLTSENKEKNEEQEINSQSSLVFSGSSQTEKQMCDICAECNKPYPPYELKQFGKDVEEATNEMRCRIEQRTRLTASAGIAPNMMLAKVCSDKNKPNGQYRILPTIEAVKEFIDDLPIRKISGIGKVTEQMLSALDVITCKNLHEKRALLFHLYSDISFNYFMRICLGMGSTVVERDSERKSMSTERTFRDTSDPADLYKKCYELSEALAADLKMEELKGKTVTLKIKTAAFEVKTRAQTIRDYTWDKEIIFTTCKDLLRIEIQNCQPKPLVLRLMGVRMSNLLHQSLCPKSVQNTISSFIKQFDSKKVAMEDAVNSSTSAENMNKAIDDNSPSSSFDTNVPVSSQNPTLIANKSPSPKKKLSNRKTSRTDMSSNSIQNLFSKSSKYVCPVCGKDILCKNEGEMNHHVDKCLNDATKSPNSLLSIFDDNQNNILKKDFPVNMKENPSLDSWINAEDTPIPSTSTSRGTTYTCPVCNMINIQSNLDDFNLHVDACLSKGTISEILKEQRIGFPDDNNSVNKKRLNEIDKKTEQVKKKRKSNNGIMSIDSFFKS